MEAVERRCDPCKREWDQCYETAYLRLHFFEVRAPYLELTSRLLNVNHTIKLDAGARSKKNAGRPPASRVPRSSGFRPAWTPSFLTLRITMFGGSANWSRRWSSTLDIQK